MAIASHFQRLAVLTVLMAQTGCHAGDSSKLRRSDEELILALDPDTLDPRYAVDVVGMRASRLLHAGLFRADGDTLAPVPYLAKSYRYRDPTTLEIDLADGFWWSDGRELTSEDVVATFRALGAEKPATRHGYLVEPLVAIEVEGPKRVVLRLREPRGGFLSDLEFPILRRDQAALPIDTHAELDGQGPLRVAFMGPGEIRLVPRENAPHPAKRAVVLRTVRDENARALRLLAGKADVAQNAIAPSLLLAISSDAHGALEIRRHAGATTTYLLLNTTIAPLTDRNYRCTIAENVDRALLTETLLEHAAIPATTLVPPGHWAHTPLPAFVPGAHKIGGEGADIAILTSTERMRMLVARTIADRLTRIGVPTDARPLELGTMIARLNGGQFEAAILQFPEFTDPSLLRQFLHSASIPPAGSNRARLRDPEVDHLLALADLTVDPLARRSVIHALELRLRELCVMIPLWHEDNVALVSTRSTFHPNADGRYTGLGD